MKGIRQLAEHLNISIGTVSRALNSKPDVNPRTRERVLSAAAALGYMPNQAGRALRKGSTGVIGFMIQTGIDVTEQGDVFFMSVFDGVQTVIARHKLDLVALLCSSNEDPDAYLRRVVARGFADALIISATKREDPRISFLAEQKIPFIALGRSLTDADHPWLDLDFEGMVSVAITRLFDKGHRRIGIFAPPDEANLGYIIQEAYRAKLAERGLLYDPSLIFRATPNESGGYQIAQQIASQPPLERPTALIITNEVMSSGLYRGLRDAKIIPGQDISIIGRDSSHARYLNPKLTGFSLSLREVGIALAEGLLATMPEFSSLYPTGTVRKVLPLQLVEGTSDQVTIEPAA